jgi:hypothetical protein
MFKHYWQDHELEQMLEQDQVDAQFNFQSQTNKELILARM